MKILITSYAFLPSIGGIETVTFLMATKFIEYGHSVKIVTHTRATNHTQKEDFDIYRRPNVATLLELTLWADVVWQNGISLTYLWPPFLMQKPKVVTLGGAIYPDFPSVTWKQRVKALAIRFCHVMAISHYVMNGLHVPYDLVGNPFDTDALTARKKRWDQRSDVVCVGRLVSDKGISLLIESVAYLISQGRVIHCTIIGDGPDRPILEKKVLENGLEKWVHFTGYRNGHQLYELIANHKIMVVPSIWKEPFGVVALEGIACGCIVIGSKGGGLPLAIGSCGLTFENGNLEELVACLEKVLDDHELGESLRQNAIEHLRKFDLAIQAEHYLDVFKALINKEVPPSYTPLSAYR